MIPPEGEEVDVNYSYLAQVRLVREQELTSSLVHVPAQAWCRQETLSLLEVEPVFQAQLRLLLSVELAPAGERYLILVERLVLCLRPLLAQIEMYPDAR